MSLSMAACLKWAVGLIVLSVLLIGCGTASNSGPTIEPSDKYNPTGQVYEKKVRLENGDVVRCLIYDRDRGGGISCDWALAQVTP